MGLWRVFSIIGGMSLLLSSLWIGGHAPAPTTCEAVIVYRSSDGAIYSLWDYQRRVELAPPGDYPVWVVDDDGWIRVQQEREGRFYRATLTEPLTLWFTRPDVPNQQYGYNWVGWSADGDWAYFTVDNWYREPSYLYRVDRMGRRYERILETPLLVSAARMQSLDEGYIVGTWYNAVDVMSWDSLYFLDSQTSTLRHLEDFPRTVSADRLNGEVYEVDVLGITPDGKLLVYEWQGKEINTAHLLDLSGTVTPLTIHEPRVQDTMYYRNPAPYTRFVTQDGTNQTYLITAWGLRATALRPFVPNWQPTNPTLVHLSRRTIWNNTEPEFLLYDRSTGGVYRYPMRPDSYLQQILPTNYSSFYWHPAGAYHLWLDASVTKDGYTLHDAPLPRTYSPCGDSYVTINPTVFSAPTSIGTVWSTTDDEPITVFPAFATNPITYVRLHGLEWHWPYLLAGAGGLLLVGVRWRRPKP